MIKTVQVPCVMMRGGTSRGPYFLGADLPSPVDERDQILLSAMGAGHPLQVDGIGGGNPLTSKVAIVSRSTRADADVDYLFAQVKVMDRVVDTSPNCGNMLSGVGPFAIEKGLIAAHEGQTKVRIFNVNTGKLIDATVMTPGGKVTFEGDCLIDGVNDPAAPIELTFLDAAGAKTGKLLPTGKPVDVINGIEVTCIDAAMPLVIMRAEDLGKSGDETPEALDADEAFIKRINEIRVKAGALMGLGDVSQLVIPKPVLISAPRHGGTLTARYFMPWTTHRSFAVTGAVGLATACATPGTLPAAITDIVGRDAVVRIEHPSGGLDLKLTASAGGAAPVASLLRTARKIFEGVLHARTTTPS